MLPVVICETGGIAVEFSSPAIVHSGDPMLNFWHNGERVGSGSIVWRARERLAEGEIDKQAFLELIASSAPSTGHCNPMGIASTVNSRAEVLGMSLPGCAALPAPTRSTPKWPTLDPARPPLASAICNAIHRPAGQRARALPPNTAHFKTT
jgi:hypothetical protein